MKLIESSYSIIPQGNGLEGMFKAVEIAARTCYKSESFIKEGSAEKMVNALIQRGHGSPLEHGTVYLKIPRQNGPFECYVCNPYSKVKTFNEHAYVTTNYRVLVENNWLDDLQYLCEPTEYHEKRYMVKFTLSRSIANEFVRHRTMSLCQESQRYCNYSLDKFGSNIVYIIPEWVKDIINNSAEEKDPITQKRKGYLVNMPIEHVILKYMTTEDRAVNCWVKALQQDEDDYLYLINGEVLKPQEARSILPNDCKTELVMTGFASDWNHFFSLRTASGAHPDARALACPLYAEFKLKNYI